jgi:hypothetical protein
MLNGLSGSLLSHDFVEHILYVDFAGRLGEDSFPQAHTRLVGWWREHASQLGPASSIRSLWDQAAAPLAEILGFTLHRADGSGDGTRVALLTPAGVALFVGEWKDSPETLWRSAVRAGIGLRASWCLCTNGHELSLVDTQRTYSRASVQFDMARAIEDPRTLRVFWGVMRAEAFRVQQNAAPIVLQIIRASARHGQAVSRSLRFGVLEAVQQLLAGLLGAKPRCRDTPSPRTPSQNELLAGFDESLTIVYRVLFLMFAEARGLVPSWHPIYRDSYTIEALRGNVEHPDQGRGLWETLQAIARLAHHGCHAGSLVVPPFNGRLFSPARAPLAESCSVDDEIARQALLALSTTRIAGPPSPRGPRRAGRRKPANQMGRVRINYRDLGVEQLGAVYESVLEYAPALSELPAAPIQLRRSRDRRKATGSFYTPQSLTDYVVRRTLHPLVERASAESILQLRILDPAMGSAAFLVAACRYLASAYERALLREGRCHEGEVDDAERAGIRRQVAQRCLFGVDLNPTAVQLARLSLWLATLAASKPLTFLDHHLVCGDSLIGASPVDLARRPPPRPGASGAGWRKNVETPWLSDLDLEPSLARAVLERNWLAETGDDTIAVVREKERRLDRLARTGGWKALADLWCACWMWPERETAPNAAVFASLADHAAHGRSSLPENIASPLLRRSRDIAGRRRFFHWMLEFPEVYFNEGGRPLPNGGFDAVVGNPPWDMVRADSGEARDHRFFRGSGVYRYQGGGHINRYQIFLERALALTKRGGRIGLVLPSGFTTDHTSSSLRRRLLTHSEIDTLAGFDNRKAIFPIHRSVRFVICTSTIGQPTRGIRCRFGIDDPAVLETIPDAGERQGDPAYPITLTPSFINALAGETLTIPELRSASDLTILERIVHRFPRLGAPDGWNARFGRELNASDDRCHLHSGHGGLPVLEGKHIEPFVAHVERSRCRISERTAERLLDPARSFNRDRLAYRDVASSTNRLSLIAAILPAGVVTTHSLFCLKSVLSSDDQAFLCGMLNSFAANYLVRQVMTTHLGSTTVEALRVPRPSCHSMVFHEMVRLVNCLRRNPDGGDAARLQGLAARCYGLTLDEFGHVLSTFPLVAEPDRAAALEEFGQCGY